MNLPDITQEIRDAVSKEIRQYPVRSNYASKLGHPCARYLTYCRLNWAELKPIDVTRKMLFDGGTMIEKYCAKSYLEKAGYEIVESQRPAGWEEKQIGGYLDFVIRGGGLPKGMEVPIEVKGLQHYDWDKLNCIEDMLFSKKSWHKSYPGQLMIYMLHKNVEYGAFLLISKSTFEPKIVWVNLDYTYAEELVKKAELINANVAKKTYPDRIEYDATVCGKCDYAFLCLPDIENKGAEFIDDEELEAKLARYLDIQPIKSEYEKIDKEIKERFNGQNVIVGSSFRIGGTFRTQTKHEYPPEIQDKYKTTVQTWFKKIIRLGAPEETKYEKPKKETTDSKLDKQYGTA